MTTAVLRGFAAVAARNGLSVVPYDNDYEIIAGVTGQATRWAAPRGTIEGLIPNQNVTGSNPVSRSTFCSA